MSINRWAGKVALVTGASSGIGAAIAVELVKKGLKVVAIARRVLLIEALRKNATGPGELYPYRADVSKEEDVKAVFDYITKTFGTIHVLVNNAGIFRFGKLMDQSTKFLKQVVDVNIMGLTICTQMALQLMNKSGVKDGHIIHINSILGHAVIGDGEPMTSIYPATKHAVTALTETLRQELAFKKSKIRVTSISPGYVETEIGIAAVTAAGGIIDRTFIDKFRDKPALKPIDVADAVIYVLAAPPHVQIHELIIKPVGETY